MWWGNDPPPLHLFGSTKRSCNAYLKRHNKVKFPLKCYYIKLLKKAVNYCYKVLHHRPLRWFWLGLCLVSIKKKHYALFSVLVLAEIRQTFCLYWLNLKHSTFPAPCIWESRIKIKMKLIFFLFLHFFAVP